MQSKITSSQYTRRFDPAFEHIQILEALAPSLGARQQAQADNHPEPRTRDFIQFDIPEIITDILMEWQRRGLESLHSLPPSPARDDLELILENALNPA